MSRDMLVESPARIPHALANDGDQVFRFLVVKVPRARASGPKEQANERHGCLLPCLT